MSSQKLPNEIIVQIINSLAPAPSGIIPISDGRSQALFSFLRVSKAFNLMVYPIIGQHCIHLDTEKRIRGFLKCVQAADLYYYSYDTIRIPLHRHVTAMAMECIGSPYNEAEAQQQVQQVPTAETVPSSSSSDTDTDPDTMHMTNVLVSIFKSVSRSLTRLVLNLPLRMWTFQQRSDAAPALRQSLEVLINLEEFVCCYDDYQFVDPGFTFDTTQLYWTRSFPRLRRVAVRTPGIMSRRFWDALVVPDNLDTLVYFIGDTGPLRSAFDLKGLWSDSVDRRRRSLVTDGAGSAGRNEPLRPFKFINIGTERIQPSYPSRAFEWNRIDPQGRIQVFNVNVPGADNDIDEDNNNDQGPAQNPVPHPNMPQGTPVQGLGPYYTYEHLQVVGGFGVSIGGRPGGGPRTVFDGTIPRVDTRVIRLWVRERALAGTLFDEESIGGYTPNYAALP